MKIIMIITLTLCSLSVLKLLICDFILSKQGFFHHLCLARNPVKISNLIRSINSVTNNLYNSNDNLRFSLA